MKNVTKGKTKQNKQKNCSKYIKKRELPYKIQVEEYPEQLKPFLNTESDSCKKASSSNIL